MCCLYAVEACVWRCSPSYVIAVSMLYFSAVQLFRQCLSSWSQTMASFLAAWSASVPAVARCHGRSHGAERTWRPLRQVSALVPRASRAIYPHRFGEHRERPVRPPRAARPATVSGPSGHRERPVRPPCRPRKWARFRVTAVRPAGPVRRRWAVSQRPNLSPPTRYWRPPPRPPAGRCAIEPPLWRGVHRPRPTACPRLDSRLIAPPPLSSSRVYGMWADLCMRRRNRPGFSVMFGVV